MLLPSHRPLGKGAFSPDVQFSLTFSKEHASCHSKKRVASLFNRLRRANLDPTDKRALGHCNQCHHHLRDVLGRDFPRCRSAMRKLRIDATWHDVTHTYVIIPVVQHHSLGEPIESKFGRVVSRSTSKRILACQTTDVDNVASAVFLH